ncbi:MAG: polyribonucleotide nucleotidyltransferase [Phycisphaerales bacterium]|nr:polyribonucleotide nucleotidyltransferase [Phycisphaerales bacterium]
MERVDRTEHVVEREIGGRTLRLSTGKIAKQAAGAVFVSYGETTILATVVSSNPRPGIDFFPMTVDYREKIYASGKFPGGFFKREGRPTNKEILTMRMIDRPLRPLFPKDFKDEVLIQVVVLSCDQQNDPDILSVIGASAAVNISGLPVDVPLAAVRMGYVDGKTVLNPMESHMEFSRMDLVVAGHAEGVNMIELGSDELSEDIVADAIAEAHRTIVEIGRMIEELREKCGKPVTWEPPASDEPLRKKVAKHAAERLRGARKIPIKLERKAALSEIWKDTVDHFCPEGADGDGPKPDVVKNILDELSGEILVKSILDEKKRSDGRGPNDLREITCEVAVLPRVHGSALFTRGETQTLVVTTLGTSRDEQIIDGLFEEFSKKFTLHYNFPPFCTGEVKRVGAVSRRELGHGALAERSLERVLPSPDDFPYTIRLSSEIMESNGSSSMASVCGGTLALMDAGVPIKQPVAGISIGRVHDDKRHVLLVDILGEEDHFGDMDFKVSGTQRGITGVQLDLKMRVINDDDIRETLALAKDNRLRILRKILEAIRRPRPQISQYAPRILTIKINPEKIGRVIGPGGKGIKGIEAETGARVDIEADGTIHVSSVDAAAAQRAVEMIEMVTAEAQLGKIYTGKVASIKDFGAFIEIMAGQDGLCHISELADGYVKQVNEVVSIGDTVRVKVIAIDDQGRIKLSRKQAIAEEGDGSAGR